MLASARNDAAVEHCRRANAGLYYANRDEFVEALRAADDQHAAARDGSARTAARTSARTTAGTRVLGRFDRLVIDRRRPPDDGAYSRASARRRETGASASVGRSTIAGAASFFRRGPMSYRLIISFSVVGLMCSSSAALF